MRDTRVSLLASAAAFSEFLREGVVLVLFVGKGQIRLDSRGVQGLESVGVCWKGRGVRLGQLTSRT
jgi:hypothetical protein